MVFLVVEALVAFLVVAVPDLPKSATVFILIYRYKSEGELCSTNQNTGTAFSGVAVI